MQGTGVEPVPAGERDPSHAEQTPLVARGPVWRRKRGTHLAEPSKRDTGHDQVHLRPGSRWACVPLSRRDEMSDSLCVRPPQEGLGRAEQPTDDLPVGAPPRPSFPLPGVSIPGESGCTTTLRNTQSSDFTTAAGYRKNTPFDPPFLGRRTLNAAQEESRRRPVRYADAFLAGHGFVCNAGEHVEGYTHFLWRKSRTFSPHRVQRTTRCCLPGSSCAGKSTRTFLHRSKSSSRITRSAASLKILSIAESTHTRL